MSGNNAIIQQAFLEAKKKGIPPIGAIVAISFEDHIAYRLDDIRGKTAICSLPNGVVKEVPSGDIVDINLVKSLAVDIKVTELESMQRFMLGYQNGGKA